jgi:2-iminobutanoate/2-iminopropanoate deaminase
MTKKAIVAPPLNAVGPYSVGIEQNGVVFLSGQVHMDPVAGKLVEGDVGAMTKLCLENLKIALKAAGLGFEHVVKTTVFLTNMGDFAAMNAVYQTYMVAPYPARSTVAVAALPLGAKVEIELVAMR